MATYVERVKRDIARWSADGLIDSMTAERLAVDIEAHSRSRISFPTIFAMMAAALLCAAVLLVVAANWQDIPRLVRVGLLLALIMAGYLGGAVLKNRGSAAFGEAAWLVAAAAFGASIALVAQMYHLSGEESDAVLTWFLGTALAAVVLRSSPLTVGAGLLSGTWMLMAAGTFSGAGNIPYLWLVAGAGLWLASWWTASSPTRHLLSLLLVLFSWIVFANHETVLVPLLVVALAGALFAVERFVPSAIAFVGLGSTPSVHGILHFLSAMAMIHLLYADDRLHFLVVVLTLAGIAAALLLSGRRSVLLRWLAYAAFALELCYVYVALLGSMLGTAGFLLMAGLSLAALAWAIRRLETMLGRPPGGEAMA